MSISLFSVVFIAWMCGVLTNTLLGGALHVLLALLSAPMLARIVQAEPPFAQE